MGGESNDKKSEGMCVRDKMISEIFLIFWSIYESLIYVRLSHCVYFIPSGNTGGEGDDKKSEGMC